MAERDPADDPYWQDDVAIGEVPVGGEPYTLRLRVHAAPERVRGLRGELVPLSPGTSECTYLHARPYILVPDIRLTVALHPGARPGGVVGRVASSAWEGMRQWEIGQAQAWHYPLDRLTILWECFPEDRHRAGDPRADALLAALWDGFECLLLDRFPATERLVTTWEDLYERDAWRAFLEARGYRNEAGAAFVRAVPAARAGR